MKIEIPKQLISMKFLRVQKHTKRPFEKDWTNKPYTYQQIVEFFPLENYGVMTGHEELGVLDDDSKDKKLIKLFEKHFIESFRVRDHYYIKLIGWDGKKVIFSDEEGNHLGELQGLGQMVVGAGSIHPSGEIYDLRKDIPIKEIIVGDFLKVFSKYIKTQSSVSKKQGVVVYDVEDDEFIKQIKTRWKEGNRQDLTLSVAGYLRKNKRLGLTNTLQIIKKVCNDCGDTDWAEREAGIRATYEKNESEIKGVSGLVEKEINVKIRDKPWIKISESGKLISMVAEEIADIYSNNEVLFYKQEIKEVVEVRKIKHDSDDKSFMGFSIIKSKRFITLSEKYFVPYVTEALLDKNNEKYFKDTPKSLTTGRADIVLASPQFQDALPIIKRIFPVQLPIMHDGKLTFPKGDYDMRFNSWLPKDSPIISNINMPLKKAKQIIATLFKEFCFENKQDFTNAVSALLTPFLQGLYKTGFNTRTPVYCYEANRERSGKDYLAGVTGILYEGCALEEPPISSGERGASGSNDELRKKITSALIAGRRRLHFSNNKGHLNNSVFESVTTATKYSDRLLGKNENVTLDNELCFSFSGNIGITLTPDLTNRTIFVSLFLDIEDANQRKFENPNLHGWVMENRNVILSALYSLVRNWDNKGMPSGSIPFASYPEWARVCGGIMESAGYNSPCVKGEQHIGISIDRDTDEMKELFELCYNTSPNIWIKKADMQSFICMPGETLMSYMDWTEHSSQIKFGKKINKFVGRILSGIRLIVKDKKIRPARWEYKFEKKDVTLPKKAQHYQDLRVDGSVGSVMDSPEFFSKQHNNSIITQKSQRAENTTNTTNTTKHSTRDLQYFEDPICDDIKDCNPNEVINYIKKHPKTKLPKLIELFGPGVMKLKSEGLIFKPQDNRLTEQLSEEERAFGVRYKK